MGRYSAPGMTTHTIDPGHDTRHRRYKNDEGWDTLELHTAEAIAVAMAAMGMPEQHRTHRGSLVLKIEPAAVGEFIRGWDTRTQTGDERFLEVMARRPRPVRLRGAVNQVLLINRRQP